MFFLAEPRNKKQVNNTRGKNRNINMGELNTIAFLCHSPKHKKHCFALDSRQNYKN